MVLQFSFKKETLSNQTSKSKTSLYCQHHSWWSSTQVWQVKEHYPGFEPETSRLIILTLYQLEQLSYIFSPNFVYKYPFLHAYSAYYLTYCLHIIYIILHIMLHIVHIAYFAYWLHIMHINLHFILHINLHILLHITSYYFSYLAYRTQCIFHIYLHDCIFCIFDIFCICRS